MARSSLYVLFFLLFFFRMKQSSFIADDPMEDTITNLINQMSLDEKCAILHGSGMFDTPGIDRLGIPGLAMSDGPHGVRFGNKTTAFPTTIALTSTWDPEYMEQVGAAYGREFRGAGKSMALGPAVDVGHDPRNGRASETIGEEPYLGGKVFAAFTRGVQSTHLIATVKHFMAQNHDGDRDSTSPAMDERTMREFYGSAFRMVVQEADVYSVMSSYNLVNGIHTSQNGDILNQMLKTEWGYKYFVVSDWWGTYDDPDKLINNGLDMEMPDSAKFNGLKDAVNAGKVSAETLNMAVRRTMRSRIKSGMLDPSIPKGNPADINSPENRQINLEAGKRAIVLLKNTDNILPLKKSGTIALVGPNADVLPITSFGSSEITDPAYKISTRQGISNAAPSLNVKYAKGCDINSGDTSGFQDAKNAASGADVVVFVGGLDNTQEGEAYGERAGKDRTGGSVMLPGQHGALIKQLAAVNPNVVVVLQSGGIVSVGSAVDSIKGLVYAWYCGSEGGDAIAQVLFGDYNPAGRLPIAMPVNDGQLPDWSNLDFTNDMISGFGYRRFDKSAEKPLFNFGHGLSYTTFSYKNLRISNDHVEGKKGVTVSVDVTNTGTRDGDEVAQLYLSSNISVPMPVKQLRGFKRLTLAVGETKTVDFQLTPYELSYWSVAHKHYFVDKGNYVARVGGSSDNLPLQISFEVQSEYAIPYGGEIVCDDCPATGIKFNSNAVSVIVGSHATLSANVLPPNATNKDVIYKTSDPTIATVDVGGSVMGLQEGATTVVATSVDGGFIDTCTVTVVKKPPCPTWQPSTNYPIGKVVSYNGESYTSTNDWNGSAGDPFTMTHSTTGWGWKVGGTCSSARASFFLKLFHN